MEKGEAKRYPLSTMPHLQEERHQQRDTLTLMPKPLEKDSRVSATPYQQHSPLRETRTPQEDMPASLPDDPEHKENNDPDPGSKAADNGEVLSIPLNSDVIMEIRDVSSSRRNFSANLNRKLFYHGREKS
jgi:hypothetical protein